MTKTAILGAGAMGESVLTGLIRAGRPLDSLLVGEKRAARARELSEKHSVTVVDNLLATLQADTLVIAVKPQDVVPVLAEINEHLRAGQLLISLAAGVSVATLESHVLPGVGVVRVMPNTPALVGEGMSAMTGGTHATEAHLDEAESLLAACGRVVRLPEGQLDAVTAISGSGPAYVFMVAEAMIESGVHLGLPRDVATELTVQTLLGSSVMLRETGTHPSVLREQVTSPGGTTAAALRRLEDHKLRGAFLAATEAARARSVELAAGS